MSRRLRRLSSVLLPVALLGGLSACGDDSSSASSPLDAVSISGSPGEEPKVDWKSELKAEGVDTETIEEGDGDEVSDGDQVSAQIWIGNGVTEKKAFSTYDAGQPQELTLGDQLSPVFNDAIAGQKIGSRIAVTTPADKVFGEAGNPQMGIGNKDSVLMIIDLVEPPAAPKPKDVAPSKLPGVIEKNGEPVGLDFKGLPKPKADGDLLRSVIKEGKGETVTDQMTVTANYLGQVYGAKEPFDESYSKKPVPFSLQSVVKGWTYGLSGVKVGSRVLLQIPPDLGYGAQAQGNIPANSTLYFVVDIIKAK
ncbi:FKBP-type peptidyl-prolyl cis-trans isomerase [Nocardioides sp. MAHUQ-72]|uniref:FKBP-type peptidyl-prolyl cis-trans isomerase n=1 Tax=unclassified Nocardioides TaxID=2615069 RepID=UPI00360BFF5B